MTHAIRFHKTGGPEVLVWEEVEVGKPGPGRGAHPPHRRWTEFRRHLQPLWRLSCPIAERAGRRGGRRGRGSRIRRDRSEARRPRRLWQRADRRLCRSAADPGRSPAQAARRHRRQDRRGHDVEGPHGAVPDPPDLSRQIRRHHPAARRGRRRRPDPQPMGKASRRHRDRHCRQRRQGQARQGPWLRPHHRLYTRGFRQTRRRDHRRQEGAGGLRFRRQGHVPQIARLPGAARRRRAVRRIFRRASIRSTSACWHRRDRSSSPAPHSIPMRPGAKTSWRWRRSCSTSSSQARSRSRCIRPIRSRTPQRPTPILPRARPRARRF